MPPHRLRGYRSTGQLPCMARVGVGVRSALDLASLSSGLLGGWKGLSGKRKGSATEVPVLPAYTRWTGLGGMLLGLLLRMLRRGGLHLRRLRNALIMFGVDGKGGGGRPR